MEQEIDKVNDILKNRAMKLAQVKKDTQQDEDTVIAILFKLAKEVFAIESSYVQEVFPIKDVTKLPCVPDFVLGLLNVRRKIFSLIDLRVLFHIPVEQQPDAKAILLSKDPIEVAIITDGILGVSTISLSDIHPPITTLSGIQLNFIKGITKDGVVFLDAEKFLTDPQIIVEEVVE